MLNGKLHFLCSEAWGNESDGVLNNIFFGKVSASYCQNICGKVHLSKVLGKFFWTYLGRFVWIMKIILLETSYFRYSNNIYVASWNYKSLIAKTWNILNLKAPSSI